MPELQLLRSDHAQAILAFELKNRDYFAASITDRGDEFFEHFPERHRALLAEQEAGGCICHVLIDSDGAVLGRFNLYDPADGTAEVGYRVAEHAAGRGVATASLRELCRLARDHYELQTLTAETDEANRASRRVLEKAGFVPVGDCVVAGKPALRYTLDLTAIAEG